MRAIDRPPPDLHSGDGGDQREAPSAIIYACHSQVKWHIAAGLVCLTLFATIPFALYQTAEQDRLVRILMGRRPTIIPDCIMGYGAGCGFLALINALFLFRCANGLRAFAQSRRIIDLHRAMRRLRSVWRVFSISLMLAVFTVVGVVLWIRFGPPP